MPDKRPKLISIALIALLTLAAWALFKDRSMPDLPHVKAHLAFTCVHEKDRIPPRDPEADQLYVHARWLRKNNLLKKDPLVYPQIERLIRIATAHGHDKANLELRNMIGRGLAASDDPVKETLDLTQELIDRGIPGGYYDMGRYLATGYGVKQDADLALKYYRKSADLGSPEGQYLVGDKLTGVDDDAVRSIGAAIWHCAAEQGHGKAASDLGIWLGIDKNYPEALRAFHLGAKAGNDTAASFASKGFRGPTDEMYYLGQQKDEERYKRYQAIWSFLADYSYLQPKVPEIDAIVPLPPAKLPAWDGSFQWLKAHEANVPPPLPSEERIREMAKAKHLDPETGRPLKVKKAEVAPEPAPPAVSAYQAPALPMLPLGTTRASGEACGQAGMWECAATPAVGARRRYFTALWTLPEVIVPGPERRLWQKLRGEPANVLAKTTWTLVSYDAPPAATKPDEPRPS
jgi:hypothetical protein